MYKDRDEILGEVNVWVELLFVMEVINWIVWKVLLKGLDVFDGVDSYLLVVCFIVLERGG